MKKIINNKVYDTDTATLKASWSNEGSWRDFRHCEESLYLKKTGEYFLYGVGGPMTQYAKAEGQNSWTGGERIMPLTYKEAQAWAEEHLSGDEYEAVFGPVAEQDTGKDSVNWTIDRTILAKAKRAAQEAGISLSAYVESRLA